MQPLVILYISRDVRLSPDSDKCAGDQTQIMQKVNVTKHVDCSDGASQVCSSGP